MRRNARDIVMRLRRLIGLERQRLQDVKALFYGPDGELKPEAERWLARLAEDNFVIKSAFRADPHVHGRNEGRRELALEIIADANGSRARLSRLIEILDSQEKE